MKTTITAGASIVLAVALFLNQAASCGAGELFHSGGTGNCDGCHGGGYSSSSTGAKNHNLRGSDASSTCLLCHQAPEGAIAAAEQHYVSTAAGDLQAGQPPRQMTPAGDFGWVRKSFSWNGQESPGELHGHSIVAEDYGYFAAVRFTHAPGGSYPSASLSCVSCHDPHGNYRRNADGSFSTAGNRIVASGSYTNSPNPGAGGSVGSYRLLVGKGYRGAGTDFQTDPPAAVAPVAYNRGEAKADTRVAYGCGMSEWCQNCHPRIHGQGAGARQHVAGNDAKLDLETMATYNNYVRSGDLNGSASTSYSSLVPFEMGTDDYAVLKGTANSDGSNLAGPGSAAGRPNVMCLSCHRAHASGWDSMTRWNVKATMIVENGAYPGTDNRGNPEYAQGRSEAEARRGYYDRPAAGFAAFQRSLCNKCHAKD